MFKKKKLLRGVLISTKRPLVAQTFTFTFLFFYRTSAIYNNK